MAFTVQSNWKCRGKIWKQESSRSIEIPNLTTSCNKTPGWPLNCEDVGHSGETAEKAARTRPILVNSASPHFDWWILQLTQSLGSRKPKPYWFEVSRVRTCGWGASGNIGEIPRTRQPQRQWGPNGSRNCPNPWLAPKLHRCRIDRSRFRIKMQPLDTGKWSQHTSCRMLQGFTFHSVVQASWPLSRKKK